MLELGAAEALGIDPSILFHCQFAAIKSLLGHPKAASLPVTLEEFNAGVLDFDTVFSMGVLYHRKDPINHLEHLKRWIKPGAVLPGTGGRRNLLSAAHADAADRRHQFIADVGHQ